MKKYFLASITFFIFQFIGFSQDVFTSKQLQEDLQVMKNVTIGLSPKLSQKDKERIDLIFSQKHEELHEQTLTTIEFINFLRNLDLKSQFDEHAYIAAPMDVMRANFSESKLFPIHIKIIGNNAIVNTVKSEIPYGAIIYSINNISIDSLLKDFSKGKIDSFQKRTFEYQLPLFYLLTKGSHDHFLVEYSLHSNTTKREFVKLEGIDFGTYQDIFYDRIFPLNHKENEKLFNTHYYKEYDTYYLQLNSFKLESTDQKGLLDFLNSEHKLFDKHFKKIFKEVANTKSKNLIIDLRYNSGGNTKVPGVFYKYIAQEEYSEDIDIVMPNFDIPEVDKLIYVDNQEITDPKQVDQFIKLYQSFFQLKTDSTIVWEIVKDKKIKPSNYTFKGNVFLLVGGISFSASSYFSALFKYHNRGVIVGEEMGGRYNNMTAGKMITYQLPHSKLELHTPIMEVRFSDYLQEKIKEEKIIPDIEFSEKVQYQYFIDKKDIEIEEVLKRINTYN